MPDIAMPFSRTPEPFDHADWIFEIKFDGLRATALLENRKVRLVSHTGSVYSQFAELCAALPGAIRARQATIDGEVVCLDDRGRPVFDDLVSRRGRPVFVAFDLLALDGTDLRPLPVLERKQRLQRIMPEDSGCILFLGHVDGRGIELYRFACENDLEGIIAKRKRGRYSPVPRTSWVEIRNPRYSQALGRPEWRQPEERRPA